LPRILAFVMVALMAGSATGVLSAFEDECVENCGDDDAGGPCCPAACSSCLCTGRAPTVLPGALPALGVVESHDALCALVTTDTPPEPDPSEILHVPRSLV
jgi:hypothetical protein